MEFNVLTALCFGLVNLGLTEGDLSVLSWPKTSQRFSRCAHNKQNIEMRDSKNENINSEWDLLKYQSNETVYTAFDTTQSSRNPEDKKLEITSKKQNNSLLPNIHSSSVKLFPSVTEDRKEFTGKTSGGKIFRQLIRSGIPLPFKLQDYTTYTVPTLEDMIEVSSQSSMNRPEGNRPPFAGQTGGNFYPQLIPPGTPWPSKPEDYTNPTRVPIVEDRIEVSSEIPNNGNRPPFSGQTGGNFYPQLIPPGTPWPSKPEDYTNSTKVPVVEDRIEVSSEIPNNGNRPPFSGQTGGNLYPQLIPPGTPWPSKPEDYTNSTKVPVVEDRIEVSSEIPNNGNRPPFSGQTGGNFYPQLIPPGTPWPSKPEDYTNFTKIPVVEDRVEISNETSNNGNRPPFSGQSGGNFSPQLIPPGTPWPSKPEDYTNSTKIPVVEDRIEVSSETPNNGNRPPFSGQSGGNFYPQLISPGTPWPSKPEDYTNSTKIPVVEDRIEVSSETPSNGNRPPFSGQSGGNFYPQLIPPGTSWPSKPEDYTNSTKIPGIEDRNEVNTESSYNKPTGSDPSFGPVSSKLEYHFTSTDKPMLGTSTEVSNKHHVAKLPGNETEFSERKRGDHLQSAGIGQNNNLMDLSVEENPIHILVDRSEASSETPTNRPLGNRPSFSGQSGGHFYPQLIRVGTPLPSKLENSHVPNLELQDRIKPSSESLTDSLTSNRPFYIREATSKNGIDMTTVLKHYSTFLGDRIGFNGHFKQSPVVESTNVFIPQIIDPDMLILDLPNN